MPGASRTSRCNATGPTAVISRIEILQRSSLLPYFWRAILWMGGPGSAQPRFRTFQVCPKDSPTLPRIDQRCHPRQLLPPVDGPDRPPIWAIDCSDPRPNGTRPTRCELRHSRPRSGPPERPRPQAHIPRQTRCEGTRPPAWPAAAPVPRAATRPAPARSVMNSRRLTCAIFNHLVHAGQQLRWPPSSVMNSRVSFITRTTKWIGMVSNAHVTSFSDFFL
jgi:hypothetical protein